ncbi:Inner membrane protein YccS OS=Streptomyces lavendulae subsp. lavendulae OX=58340 GN=yccS2 PE=4 SV=1 [Streptomyces lavendulae subsp. lavendulae]
MRSEFQRALTEPPPTGPRAAAWWPLVVAVERIVDATTAARVRVNHGAAPPAAEEVAALRDELHGLARGVRSSPTLKEVRVRPLPPEARESVLAPVHQEVVAARAIAQPER